MAKKVYKAYFLKSLSIDLPDGSTIAFQGGIYSDSMAKFTTDDTAIQEQLEACRGFNDTFYLESVTEDAPVVSTTAEPQSAVQETSEAEEQPNENAPLTDVKDVKRFHNIVEMRAAMAEIGFEGVQEMNYAQLKSAAAKEGYDFQIQK